ncbi:uncharacterized membrane protein At4g09580-like [Musa acuminata AAA Group]|uniref:uncharacterized membrane protein At4g09580-like n=1 Tax=Musa acuminata AAA Group TaxID=214697 RepID=UPI0031D0E294
MMRSLLAALRRSVPTLVSMAPLRNATGPSDEEIAVAVAVDRDDSPTAKKPLRAESRIPLFVIFSVGLLCIFLTMPEAEHDTILRLTRHLSVLKLFFNLHLFADVHDTWYRILVITGWISFGVIKCVILIVLCATYGASSCTLRVAADLSLTSELVANLGAENMVVRWDALQKVLGRMR